MVHVTCHSLVSGEHPLTWKSKEIVWVREKSLNTPVWRSWSFMLLLAMKRGKADSYTYGWNKICPKLNTSDFCLRISGRYLCQTCTRSPVDPVIRAEGLSIEQDLKLLAWSPGMAHSHLWPWQCSSLFGFQLWSPHKGIRKAMLLPSNVCLLFRRL